MKAMKAMKAPTKKSMKATKAMKAMKATKAMKAVKVNIKTAPMKAMSAMKVPNYAMGAMRSPNKIDLLGCIRQAIVYTLHSVTMGHMDPEEGFLVMAELLNIEKMAMSKRWVKLPDDAESSRARSLIDAVASDRPTRLC